MAETFNWSQRNGPSSSPTDNDLGSNGNLFNFKSVDDATASNYASNAITASDATNQGNSFEVWLRAHFTGTFTKIDNIQFWKSTDFSPNTGLTVKWKGNNQTSYVTPTANDSTIATTAVPTADPNTANVSIGGSLSGNLSSPGYSDFIVLQLHIGASVTGPGDTSLATFTLQYDVV